MERTDERVIIAIYVLLIVVVISITLIAIFRPIC